MSHLVRCRGGEWKVSVLFDLGRAWFRLDRRPKLRRLPGPLVPNWNLTPRIPEAVKAYREWFPPDLPAWLPIAWLCCEADPAEGPGFAAAILDAEPGDDAMALIACDWLWDLGAEGVLDSPANLDCGADLQFRYSLASWCRHLIATRCVSCGGRQDGEDRIEVRGIEWVRNRPISGPYHLYAPEDCPLCGFPAHPAPPPLAIPEVVR